MITTELYKSPVSFDPEAHTYSLGEKKLSGVTGLLSRTLFKDKYSGIDDATLAKAADRGHYIHEQIELYCFMGGDGEWVEEVKQFAHLCNKHDLTVHCNEYLVSDESDYATCIDLVFKDASIGDIKTTSHLDTYYLQWQLSICAYLFEKNNPDILVPHLYALWLPKEQYGKPKVVQVQRIGSDRIEQLMLADMGQAEIPEEWYPVKKESIIISENLMQRALELKMQIDGLTQELDAIKVEVKNELKRQGASSAKNNNVQFIYKQGGQTSRFNTTQFKEDHPELYEKYVSTMKTNDSITLKLIQ